MEELILWVWDLIKSYKKKYVQTDSAIHLDVSKNAFFLIRHRFISWILILESTYVILRYSFNIFIIFIGKQIADPIRIATEGIWVVCAITVFSAMYSARGGKHGVYRLILLWYKLLDERKEILPYPKYEKMHKEERYHIKCLLIIYGYTIVCTSCGVTSYFITYPETTIYIYNLFNFHLWVTDPSTVSILKSIFTIHELIWICICAFAEFANEIFIQIFATRMKLMLQSLEFLLERGVLSEKESIMYYKKLVDIMHQVNGIFKWWIYRLQYILIFFVTVIVLMCVRTFDKLPFLAQMTCISAAGIGIFRNVMLLTPMGIVNSKSRNLLGSYSEKFKCSDIQKELKSLRPLDFENGSFYYVDSQSAMRFVDLVIGQVISCLNTF